jgi:hypothetical protein
MTTRPQRQSICTVTSKFVFIEKSADNHGVPVITWRMRSATDRDGWMVVQDRCSNTRVVAYVEDAILRRAPPFPAWRPGEAPCMLGRDSYLAPSTSAAAALHAITDHAQMKDS